MSLFQIKNFADEYFSALSGKPVSPPVDEDETVVAVAEDIEETTRDFIIKWLAKELKGNPFEHFIAHLLQVMGYRTRVTQASGDGGVDILAHKDELGFEPPIIKVQVKAAEGSVGDPRIGSLRKSREWRIRATRHSREIHEPGEEFRGQQVQFAPH